MRCYLSGKISGLPYQEAVDNFEKAEKEVEQLGYEPLNPMKLCPFNPDWTWEDYMENDLGALLKCHAIYMQKNWGSSRGARCEYALAKELGISIYFQDELQY